MKRRTRKLLVVLVAAPLVLIGIGATAYAVRQAQSGRITQRSLKDGRAAFAAGRFEQALPLLARYVGRNQADASALIMLAQCRAQVPKPEGTELLEAARYAEAALGKGGEDTPALELLVDYYTRLNFITELGRVSDRLLELKPDHADAITAKIRALVALGRYDDARPLVERLARLDPSDVFPFRLLLDVRRLQGASPADLAAEAGKLADSSPGSFELQVLHAQMLARGGDAAGSLGALSRAADLKPLRLATLIDFLGVADQLTVSLRVGPTQLDASRPGVLAQSMLESALADPALAAGAAAVAASREWKQERFEAARGWIVRGLAIEPQSAALHAWEAIISRGSDAHQVAEAGVPDASSSAGWTGLLVGLAQLDRGVWNEAERTLAAVARQARDPLATPASRRTNEDDRRRAEALDLFLLANYFRGYALSAAGDWSRAVQAWSDAADIDPTWSLPLIAAASCLLEHGQPGSALALARRAAAVRPSAAEGLVVARAAVASRELGGPSEEPLSILASLLETLESNKTLRGEVLCLRARLAAARRDQQAVDAAIAAALSASPPPGPAVLTQAADRIRAAGLSGWRPLLDAADRAAPSVNAVVIRARDTAEAGRGDEAIAMLRGAATGRDETELIPLKLEEARILAMAGSQEQARQMLREISTRHAGAARAQMAVLDQPAAWTDAALIEAAVSRLRVATSEDGIEWRLADATRLLTFKPEPARAQEVIVGLTRIVRNDPRNARALALLAEWMLIIQNEPSAIEYLTRAVDAPDSPPALYPRLVDLLKQAGRREDARARLQQFAEVEGLSLEARRARARLLAEFRFTDLARKDLEVIAAAGAPGDRINFAAALLAQGEGTAAIAEIDRVLALPSLPHEALIAAADLLIDAGQADRALSILESRSKTERAVTAADRARLLERAGRAKEAEQVLRESASSASDAAPYIALARYYMRQFQPAAARQAVAEAGARGLHSKELDAVDALAVSRTGALTANQQQTILESIPPGPARELAETARWFDQNPSQTQEFITRLRAITAVQPDLVLGWQFLVNALMDVGQTDQAIAAARTAADANPQSEVAARLAAMALAAGGPAPEARAAAQRWQSLSSDPFEPVILLARLETRETRPDAAAALLDGLESKHGADARAVPPQHWAALVSCYAQIGRCDRAREAASRRDPKEAGWSESMADIAGGEATPVDAAREWLESLRPVLSTSLDGPARLAGAFATLGYRSGLAADFQAALTLLEPNLGSEQSPTDQLLLAATLYEQVGRAADAEFLYRRVLRRTPDHWVAMNNLAYLLLDRPNSSKESLSLARRASELAQAASAPAAARSSTLQTLAMALLRAGQSQEALETVRRAIPLDRASGEAVVTEAEALEATGDNDRAKAAALALLRQADAGRLQLKDGDRTRAQALIDRLGGQSKPISPTKGGSTGE